MYDFNYIDKGNNWPELYPKCGGLRQSPIDLDTKSRSDVLAMEVLGKDFKNYDVRTVFNTIAGIAMEANEGKLDLKLGDGAISDKHEAQYVIFKAPSEHCIDKKRYELEMQIIMKKPEQKNPSAAIAIFFDSSIKDVKTLKPVKSDLLHTIRPKRSTALGELTFDVQLKKFLSSVDYRFFWSYEGSLTTPPCTEGIQWTVVNNPMPMLESQLEDFNFHYKSNNTFANGNGNIRGPQPLNNRKVYFRNNAMNLYVNILAALTVTSNLLAL